LPSGAVLMADEQDGDAATGITTAHGHAELWVEKKSILGRADTIELNPASNQIRFKGRAVVTVGRQRYESDAVICTLDFDRCGAATDSQALPAPAASGVSSGPPSNAAAVTNPQ
jgi:hypothetical protein